MYDISFWRSTEDEPLHRLGREVHYPPIIDVLDPYILLVHQGMVESLFIEDMRKRGVEVRRNTAFESYNVPEDKSRPLQVNCRTNVTQDRRSIHTQYLIGCKLVHFDAALAISLLFALFITHQAYILHLMEKIFP